MSQGFTCAGCALWGGDESAYLADCPVQQRRTQFSERCSSYRPRQPPPRQVHVTADGRTRDEIELMVQEALKSAFRRS